jgi:deoxyribodipyrimidine photo-lyase
MSKAPIIIWFRQDLRLSDNPALHEAYDAGHPIIPLYILDDKNAEEWKMGAASRVWLHHALDALNKDLSEHLVIEKGDATEIIPDLINKTGAQGIYWNRCYEPWRIKRDENIKSFIKDNMDDVEVKSFQGSLLWEPWTISTQGGTPYKVFTPFYKKGCLQSDDPRKPLPRPERLTYANTDNLSLKLEELDLLPKDEGDWPKELSSQWTISEEGANKRLQDFIDDGLDNYKTGRNHPAWNNVSKLSPYLHWGQISPNTAWYQAKEKATHPTGKDLEHFLSELGWREFSYNLLYHFPKITWENLNEKFNDFPWSAQESEDLERWRRGQTGYPIVDAGMRQLYQTGYMHNRLRMIVGSFLVKNMLVHWHKGEEWFWNCLFDADLASNSASWQWIAGCGADAAPYFRIFNPILQSKKFDENGEFIRKYVPELKDLKDNDIHAPWEAPEGVLKAAGVELGKTYPKPMMDHSDARDKAMEAYQSTKSE